MNARNISRLLESLEESVGKILTIMRAKPEEIDETILLPVVTLRALDEECSRLIECLPYIHHSTYIKELGKVMQNLRNWLSKCPDTLSLDQLDISNQFKKIQKEFVDLCFQAHSIQRDHVHEPSTRDHWTIQYMSDHMLTSHSINLRQKERIQKISAEVAENQAKQILSYKAKLAEFHKKPFNRMLAIGPNGLDEPFVYWGDAEKIEKFMLATKYHEDNMKAVFAFETENQSSENRIPAVIARIEAEMAEEAPKKRIRTDDDQML